MNSAIYTVLYNHIYTYKAQNLPTSFKNWTQQTKANHMCSNKVTSYYIKLLSVDYVTIIHSKLD